MPTHIAARHVEVPNGLRAHIEQSVGKLDRFYNGIHGARVTLNGSESGQASAEVLLTVSRRTLTARQTAPSHREAVDECVRQLRRQVLRYKDGRRGH